MECVFLSSSAKTGQSTTALELRPRKGAAVSPPDIGRPGSGNEAADRRYRTPRNSPEKQHGEATTAAAVRALGQHPPESDSGCPPAETSPLSDTPSCLPETPEISACLSPTGTG